MTGLSYEKIIIIINEIFIQDVHFSVTYIAINMYPVINVKLK